MTNESASSGRPPAVDRTGGTVYQGIGISLR